ncbi:MAG TPA: tRNA (adenosine(37)-N6)-threonylcarbamoyltransferase complex ATPase subunit type 1 TsaE [Steroidobacteraceae bacterium]
MRQSSSALLNIATPDEMRALGATLGQGLRTAAEGALVVALEGELGAGKTTLVGGLLHALGVAGPIRSPSYTLVEPYEVPGLKLYHVDLYRLADPDEVDALALRELLTPGSVLLIEWSSRAADRLPAADLTLEIEYSKASDAVGTPPPGSGHSVRLVTLRSGSSVGDKLVEQIVAAASQ